MRVDKIPTMNAEQLISIQGVLHARERQLCSQLQSAIFELFGSDLPGLASNESLRHQASKSLFDDDNNAYIRRNINELMAIESAREAINQGLYGECEKCHGEIEFSRLLALPWATCCRECQKHINRPEPTLSQAHA